ncbi:unnamed protein product [Chironomus riparius]|uniref:Uncharacterized protein n=1 Tax=Chironomus riparius TaxID=315576 RepID=A0A9P0JB11_9DIPT|nr:unnamed protein product [Chironomus riparius]
MQKLLCTLLIIAAFSASSNALRIRCDFQNMTWTFGNAYTCLGNVIDNVDEEVLEIENDGMHPCPFNNSDVWGLFIRNQNVTNLPLDIGWKFPNLRGLECDNCNLISLRSSMLERLTNLLHFAVPRNRIRNLPGNMFRFTINLEWVYLHGNQISNAGFNVLKVLRRLQGIFLAGNGCISRNAMFDNNAVFGIMHSLATGCPPTLDDFIRDTENSECTYKDEDTSHSRRKGSSEEKSKRLAEELVGWRDIDQD